MVALQDSSKAVGAGIGGDPDYITEPQVGIQGVVPFQGTGAAPEEGDEPIMVRLDLEALERALDEEGSPEAQETHEDLAEELEDELSEGDTQDDIDEEIELDEEILNAIAEELKVDVGIPDQGLGGRTTPTDRNLEGQKAQLAALKDDELAEEHELLGNPAPLGRARA